MSKYLIVGLGNPGREYEKTRHNAGWWVLDELMQRHGLSGASKEKKALVTTGSIGNKNVILAKPQTYMNLSGEAVRALLDFYKLEVERLIVVHDDLDTPLGQIRLRKSGGHGGQNGIRNIILHLGTQDFARLRFGIGRPPGKMPARDYVLHPFTGDDAISAQQMISRSADALELWLKEGMDAAMNRVNGEGESQSATKPDPAQELAVVLRAVELAPSDPKAREALAKLYQRLGKTNESVQEYARLAELFSAQDNLRQTLWAWEQIIRVQAQDYATHERIARAQEARDPKRATQAWLRMAETAQEHGALEQARYAVEQALRVNPIHDRALALRDTLK